MALVVLLLFYCTQINKLFSKNICFCVNLLICVIALLYSANGDLQLRDGHIPSSDGQRDGQIPQINHC